MSSGQSITSVYSKLVLLVLMSFSGRMFSQATGEWMFEEYPESVISNVSIVNNNLTILIQSTHRFPDTLLYDYITSFVEADLSSHEKLEFIERFNKNSGKKYNFGYSLHRVNSQWFYVESSYGNVQSDTVSFIVFDSDFNPISTFERSIYIGLSFYCDVVLANGDIVGIGSVLDIPDSLMKISYLAVDTPKVEMDVFRTNPEPGIAFVSSMVYDTLRNRFVVFHLGGISHLNDTLGLIARYPGSIIHTSQHGSVLIHDGMYYSFGATASQGSPEFRDLVFQKYDTSMNIMFADTFGRSGMDDYPFINISLALSNDNFFVGGMLGGPSDFSFRNTLKYFIAKYNRHLEREWYREFGGSHSYVIRGLKVLDDGRMLLYGSRVDQNNGTRYPYLMLLNKDGEITQTEDIPDEGEDFVQSSIHPDQLT